jgi:transcriptional regulator with XRE-family HTH domain
MPITTETGFNSDFAIRLRELLKKHPKTSKSTSQTKIAEMLYVTQQAVSNWTKGISTPSLDNLKPLATYFGMSIDELVTGISPKNEELHIETGLSDKAINKLNDLKNRQDKPGYDTLISKMILEFFSLLIENTELDKGHIFHLASQSIDYMLGLHRQLLIQEEIEKQHEEKMSKDKEYAAFAFDVQNTNLKFHAYQIAKYFEDAIVSLAKDTKNYTRIKKIYDGNFCLPPEYNDVRFANTLSWRVKESKEFLDISEAIYKINWEEYKNHQCKPSNDTGETNP